MLAADGRSVRSDPTQGRPAQKQWEMKGRKGGRSGNPGPKAARAREPPRNVVEDRRGGCDATQEGPPGVAQAR